MKNPQLKLDARNKFIGTILFDLWIHRGCLIIPKSSKKLFLLLINLALISLINQPSIRKKISKQEQQANKEIKTKKKGYIRPVASIYQEYYERVEASHTSRFRI